MKKFLDKHKDKMAFVLGSGPSLKDLDPMLLKNHIVIAVNSTILKVPQADYYFSCDFGMTVWRSWLTLKNLACELILYNVDVGFRHLEYLTKQDTFEGINENRITYFDMNFSKLRVDKSLELICGATSTQVAVHFAYILGCFPIVLLGCDNKYVEGKYHYYDFPNQPVDDYRKPEFADFKSKNLIIKNKDSNKYLDGYVVCWEKIIKQSPDLNVIDASGGNLTMFPQMSLKKVIELYG